MPATGFIWLLVACSFKTGGSPSALAVFSLTEVPLYTIYTLFYILSLVVLSESIVSKLIVKVLK